MVPQPDWWPTLAYYTDWFDWQAVGALATAWAVWLALAQGRADHRRRRDQHLRNLGQAHVAISGVLGSCNDFDSQFPTLDRTGLLVLYGADNPSMRDALADLHRLLQQEFPDHKTWSRVGRAHTAIQMITVLAGGSEAAFTRVQTRIGIREQLDELQMLADDLMFAGRVLPAGGLGRFAWWLHCSTQAARERRKAASHASPPRTAGPTDGTAGRASPGESA